MRAGLRAIELLQEVLEGWREARAALQRARLLPGSEDAREAEPHEALERPLGLVHGIEGAVEGRAHRSRAPDEARARGLVDGPLGRQAAQRHACRAEVTRARDVRCERWAPSGRQIEW